MIAKSTLIFLLLSSIVFAEESCSVYQTEGELGFERSGLSGSLQDGSLEGTKLDIKNDLGISHQTAGLKAMMNKSTTHHKFGFKLEKYEHSGSKKLSSNILYNGAQYATASLINSKISLKWAKIKYRYRFTPDFALGTDINGLRLKTMVNDEETKKTLLIPALAFDYETTLEEGLRFIAKGSSTITGTSNHHYAYAGFSYDLKVIGCSSFNLGYQYKILDIHADDIHAKLKYQGLYAGLAMKF